jgi:membrane-associated phospholipid phosphatase
VRAATDTLVKEQAPRTWPLRALVAFVVAFVSACAFLLITQQVLGGHTNALDRSVSLWIHGWDSPGADLVMRTFTTLGAYASIGVAAAAVTAWCLRSGGRKAALVVVVTTVGSMLLTSGLKLLFRRTRPDLFFEVAMPETWSFPSGHSLVSLASYGTMAIVVARLAPRLRGPLAVLAPLFIVMVGVSRVYLGVHWPTDVAAGFACGVIVLIASFAALGPHTEHREETAAPRDRIVRSSGSPG